MKYEVIDSASDIFFTHVQKVRHHLRKQISYRNPIKGGAATEGRRRPLYWSGGRRPPLLYRRFAFSDDVLLFRR